MPTAPYGSWKSPITADAILASSIGLAQPQIAGDTLYWIEGRPNEGGRNVIVRRLPDGRTEDVIPPPFNARTRVHEYGGADYLVDPETPGGHTIYFANFADQRLYIVRAGAAPLPLTSLPDPVGLDAVASNPVRADAVASNPDGPDPVASYPVRPEPVEGREPATTPDPQATSRRYADFILDRPRNRLVAVRETHYAPGSDGAHVEPANDIAAIDLATGAETALTSGHDFYAYPRLSPDGRHLAWIAWDHPDMPWDATRLYVAALTPAGALEAPRQLAGGPDESVLQPTWSPDNRLHFLSDRTGFWNLYRLDAASGPVRPEPGSIDPVRPEPGSIDPVRPEPGSIDPVRPGPGSTDPARPEPGSIDSVRPEPVEGRVGFTTPEPATALCPQPHDFAQPLWQLGTTTYAFDSHPFSGGNPAGGGVAPVRSPGAQPGDPTPEATLLTAYCVDGLWRLARLDPETGHLADYDIGVASVRELTIADGRACFIAGFATQPTALVSLDIATGALETLKPASTLDIDPGYVSIAQPIEFPTTPPPAHLAHPEALEGGGSYTAHAFYYPPRNRDYEAAASQSPRPPGERGAAAEAPIDSPNRRPLSLDGEGQGEGVAAAPTPTAHPPTTPPLPQRERGAGGEVELPPLLVMSHGGPTAATAASLSARVQYWTSRGIAVLDVNYGGSTGYGRDYRNRLRDNWGIVDVLDCINGARYLAGQGLVDRDRLAITGGSAGGYTTLAALTFHDVFKAGASHYGIGDLEALATDTHKFESRYLDTLVGRYPGARDTYVERSPIHHTDRLQTPVIFFQGLEDQIVPPNQAQTMVEALRRKGIPVAYFPFEGEQHGFRRAENIKRALEAELLFYGRVFNFTPSDDIEPFDIENLPG